MCLVVLAANNGTWRGIQYVEHTEGDGVEMFKAVCKLGLEGIVSKKLDAPYKSGPSKAWLKSKIRLRRQLHARLMGRFDRLLEPTRSGYPAPHRPAERLSHIAGVVWCAYLMGAGRWHPYPRGRGWLSSPTSNSLTADGRHVVLSCGVNQANQRTLSGIS
jgi:hypothetical protein